MGLLLQPPQQTAFMLPPGVRCGPRQSKREARAVTAGSQLCTQAGVIRLTFRGPPTCSSPGLRVRGLVAFIPILLQPAPQRGGGELASTL